MSLNWWPPKVSAEEYRLGLEGLPGACLEQKAPEITNCVLTSNLSQSPFNFEQLPNDAREL